MRDRLVERVAIAMAAIAAAEIAAIAALAIYMLVR